MQWLSDHWPYISGLLLIAINVVNLYTKHYSHHKGIAKALLFVAEMLSVLKSAGDSKNIFKLPGQSKPVDPPA